MRVHIVVAGLVAAAAWGPDALASEASTHFSIFVPPNDSNNGRHSALTITAHSANTVVTVTDTAEDGDTDDSTTATLGRGQSIVVRVRDGAVNDGAGGKWDGDRFIIDATQPVTAMLSTRSDWQHDWVPAEGRTMRGNEFFVWAPMNGWDFDVVAYEDDTRVEIYEISTAATNSSGVTTVSLPGTPILRQRLDRGQDLLTSFNRAGTNITRAGHSYRVVVSRPATVMFGAFYQRERDGGGYVPAEDGTTVGRHFYFPVPSGRWQRHEREIRIVAGQAGAGVTLRGYDASAGWVDIASQTLAAYGHVDFTGRANRAVQQYDLYEVIATADVNVFEANWLETGNSGTSDIISYVSALDGVGASDVGQEFVAYIGPPGIQNRVLNHGDRFSHLYVAAFVPGTVVTVVDADTNGTLYSETATLQATDDIHDFRITRSQYNAMNNPSQGIRPYLRVQATQPVSVGTANWNDNWLAFASGVLPASLRVEVTEPDSIRCNTNATFALEVENIGTSTVTNVVVGTEPVGPLVLSGAAAPIGTLAPGAVSTQNLTGQVSCNGITSGDVVGVSVTATGDGASGETQADRETSTSEVVAPGVVGIPTIGAAEDACAVEVQWTTEEDAGNAEFVILRREFGPQGPYTELGRVASVAPAMSGFVYGFRDITAAQNTPYQYLVRAVDAMSGTLLTTAGPIVAVPGSAFASPPGATGNLVADFADDGVILTDPTGDILRAGAPVDGYDIDGVGIAYDPFTDSLYLAASAVGVFGDGDGDGDPDTNTLGAAAGITDRPRFSVDESFVFVLDLDGNGTEDAVVGIPFGTDLDFLQASPANPALVNVAPSLAFTTLTTAQAGSLIVQLVNEPSAARPDLQLVVRNISVLNNQQPLSDVRVRLAVSAPSVTSAQESAPAATLTPVGADTILTAGCGVPAQQIHLGTFAVFGNVFSGTPRFEFIPLGWHNTDDDVVLAPPPNPVPGQVVTSPTIFIPDQHVDIGADVAPTALQLPTQSIRIRDSGGISGNDYLHVTNMDWDFSAASGNERYESFDAQTFRMFVLDCTATVVVEQFGTSGVLRDDRFVRLADGTVQNLGPVNPALILAHSGLGTFETGGAMQRVHFGSPEDWVTDFGPMTSPEFTQYAFLDDVRYLGNTVTPNSTEVYPLSPAGVQVGAGIWFVNHYMWTYANEGSTRIETRFIPGPDCGGSL